VNQVVNIDNLDANLAKIRHARLEREGHGIVREFEPRHEKRGPTGRNLVRERKAMMGKYLDIMKKVEQTQAYKNDINDKTHTVACENRAAHNSQYDFGRLSRFGRSLHELERRCPDLVDCADWEQAIEGARRFLAQWGEQAENLGWTSRDLFGLAPVPDKPVVNYRRLSRYDLTGLVWLLRGDPVVALTETSAAVRHAMGHITTYRRFHKPAFGPLGDSLDDMGTI
jgi:hypothetical protein